MVREREGRGREGDKQAEGETPRGRETARERAERRESEPISVASILSVPRKPCDWK